jgi:hypothetical protein
MSGTGSHHSLRDTPILVPLGKRRLNVVSQWGPTHRIDLRIDVLSEGRRLPTVERRKYASGRRIFVACGLCQQDQWVDGSVRKWPSGPTRLSDKLSAISLARLLKWLGEISSWLIAISIAVDAAADVPLLKSIVRHGKHNIRRPRRISAPQDATVQSSSNPVIGAPGCFVCRSEPG